MLFHRISRKRWNIYWWLKRTITGLLIISDYLIEIATLTWVQMDLNWYWMFGEEGCVGNPKTCKSKIHKLSLYLDQKDQEKNQL